MTLWELFVRISGDASGHKKAMKESQDANAAFETSFDKLSDKLTRAAGFASIGIAAGIAAKSIFHAGETMEEASVTMQRATGAAGDKLAGMERAFKDIYTTSEMSAEGIAAALVLISQKTGATGKSLEDLTRTAEEFAHVTNSDLKTSVQENQKLFEQWDVATKDQAVALDMLYVASQRTGISTTKLSESMLELGPSLRNLGYNFESSVALIASFEKNGLDATSMVAGLNKAFVEFAKAGKDPREALQDLIEQMQGAATRAEALNLALDAGFSAKVAGRFVDAVRSGAFNLADLMKALDNSTGAVKDMADKTETLSEEWTKFKRQMSVGLFGDLSKQIVSESTGVLAAIDKFISELGPRATKATELISAIFHVAMAAANQHNPMNPMIGAAQAATGNGPAAPAPSVPGAPGSIGTQGDRSNAHTGPTQEEIDAYTEKLLKAESVLGVHVASLRELRGALATVYQAYKSGTVGEGVWIDAQKQYLEQLGKFSDAAETWAEKIRKVMMVGQVENGVGMFGSGGPIPALDVQQIVALPQTISRVGDMWGEVTALAAEYASEQDRISRNAQIDADDMQLLGVHAKEEYSGMAWAAMDAYDRIANSGKLSANQQLLAWANMRKSVESMMHEMGALSDAQYQLDMDALNGLTAGLDKLGRTSREHVKSLGEELAQSTHRMFDGLERSIAESLVEWNNWGDAVKNIFKQMAVDVVSILEKQLFAPLEKKLSDFLGSLSGGSPGGGGGASAAAEGGQSAGQMAGTFANNAQGGTAGLVIAVAQLVSSIVGNFQMHGMNQSLDLIVSNTLKTWAELVNLRADEWTREQHWYARTDGMWQTLIAIKDAISHGISTNGNGSGLSLTFTSCSFVATNPNAIAKAIFDQAALAGAI